MVINKEFCPQKTKSLAIKNSHKQGVKVRSQHLSEAQQSFIFSLFYFNLIKLINALCSVTFASLCLSVN